MRVNMHIYRKYNLSIYKMQKFTATRLSIQVRRPSRGWQVVWTGGIPGFSNNPRG